MQPPKIQIAKSALSAQLLATTLLALMLHQAGCANHAKGFDPNAPTDSGRVGAQDKTSIDAQKLMSGVWCRKKVSPRGNARLEILRFISSGDLAVQILRLLPSGDRGEKLDTQRGTWALENNKLITRYRNETRIQYLLSEKAADKIVLSNPIPQPVETVDASGQPKWLAPQTVGDVEVLEQCPSAG